VSDAEERTQPPEGSEPEGPGFGKPWVPRPGVTFVASGAYVRSLIDLTEGREGRALIGMDVTGKWNHAAPDTLSIVVSPDVALEWAEYIIEAHAACEADERRWRAEHG
jgi:hypothetical protein